MQYDSQLIFHLPNTPQTPEVAQMTSLRDQYNIRVGFIFMHKF